MQILILIESFYEIKAVVNFLTGCDPIPFLAKDFRNGGTAFIPMIIDNNLNRFKIGFSDCHFGREEHILANRRKVYEKARRRNPNRWSKNMRNWNPVHQVWLNPEKKDETNQMHCLKKAA